MKLVVLLRSSTASPLIPPVKSGLRQLGYDVCVAPSGEFGALRESVLRSLLLAADAVVGLWTEEDWAEFWFSEIVTDAKRARKLVGGGEATGRPGSKGAEPIGLTPDSVIAAVTARLGLPGPADTPQVSAEYAALRRAAASGDAPAWGQFLAEHPDGAFRALAEAEHESAGAPAYRSPGGDDRHARSTPWRLGLGAPAWVGPAAGVGACAVALALSLYVTQPMFAAAPNDVVLGPSPSAALVADAAQPFAHADVDAPAARADDAEASDLDALTQVAPSLEARTIPADAVVDDELRPRLSLPPMPVAQPSPQAQLETIARRPLAPNAFDRSQVEPGLRSVIEQARRRQAYAEDRARQFSTMRDLPLISGRYQGEWEAGANGLGVASFANGDRYAGSWRRSEPNGMGVLRMRNGARYEGEFANGAPTGRGVFWRQDGVRLTGADLFRELVAATQASQTTSLQ